MSAPDEIQPIWIPCEGSGARPNLVGYTALCPMCGTRVTLTGETKVSAHQRQDILAMIDRGDFG